MAGGREAGAPALPECPSMDEIAAGVRSGRESAAGAGAAALDRIAGVEPAIRAWRHLDAAAARERAQAIDDAGPHGALAGVPVGIKDIIDTADQPTENGTPLDAGRRPQADATVVRRLRAAGALILGKTVTTELACGASGATRNPHAPARTPGGSSSGSAATVAAGGVPLALGTQTAGSVVRPAAFCGVWGMKPSFGTIPALGRHAALAHARPCGCLRGLGAGRGARHRCHLRRRRAGPGERRAGTHPPRRRSRAAARAAPVSR